MMRRNAAPFWLGFALLLLMLPATAISQRRIALVIGNADYKEVPRLLNPVKDARDIAKALRALQFEVIEVTNANRRGMFRAIERFDTLLQQAQVAVGLFYYSGHGVQHDNNNYLIPLEVTIERPSDFELDAVDVRKILNLMEQSDTQVNIVILDACRDNPFRNLSRYRGYGSDKRGLALPPVSSSLIAYATQPNDVADDGEPGQNGIYTKHLLRYITQPRLSLLDFFSEVSQAVRQETSGKQKPWTSFSSVPHICLAGCEPSLSTPMPVSQPSSQLSGTDGMPTPPQETKPPVALGVPTSPALPPQSPPSPEAGFFLTGKVVFDFNKVILKPEAKRQLAGVLQVLKEHPGVQVQVVGHTDGIGSDDYNMKLSERRAESVVTYLIQNGVPRESIRTDWRGKREPIASNATAEGRAENNRVEITLVPSLR